MFIYGHLLLCGVDSGNQTVIINESTSSDGSVAAQLRQQAQQLAAASVLSQPVITSTSSAPDVFYTETMLPCIGNYHDDNGKAPESSYVCFEEHGGMQLPQQNWAVTPSRQDVTPQPQIPAYRPAPDYDAVMQQRLLSQYYPTYIHPYLNLDCTSFSQPDIYQHSAVVDHWNLACARTPASVTHGGHVVDRASSLMIHPEAVGVARHASVASSIVPRVNQYLYYRAPPPYPRQSSSTPDLASPTKLSTILTHGGPDFRQQRLMQTLHQSQFDESLENLAAEVQHVQIYNSHSIHPGYGLTSPDNPSVQLGHSGLDVHRGNIVDISVPSTSIQYGHSTPSAGARFDHRNNEANRLTDFVHYDEYVMCFFVKTFTIQIASPSDDVSFYSQQFGIVVTHWH